MSFIEQSNYQIMYNDIVKIIVQRRENFVRKINKILVEMYWEIGRRIIEEEQKGKKRANYGFELIKKLSFDLSRIQEKGFGNTNLKKMRLFYLTYPQKDLLRSNILWSHYQNLITLDTDGQRRFYEDRIIQEKWSVRQLAHNIHTFLYERTIGNYQIEPKKQKQEHSVLSVEDTIKDPYILDFLKLQNKTYQESDMESAIISHIEDFLIELGSGFSFVGRQKRIQIGDEYYYVDLMFFHRGLKAVVLIDLKIGKFTHSDAGQMNMYINYFRENDKFPGEKDPIGIILCADKNEDVVRYALGQINQKIFVSRYKTQLPSEKKLLQEVQKGKLLFERNKLVPENPVIESKQDSITFLKIFAKKKKKFFISEYAQSASISRTTAYRNTREALKKGWLESHGKGRGAHYLYKE